LILINPYSFAVPSFSFGAGATDDTNTDTYTFASQAIGAVANRSLVVAILGHKAGGSRSLSGITIGGVSATTIAARGGSIGGDMWLAYATGVSGTTADVVLTLDGASARACCQTFALYNLSSTTPSDTAHDDDGSIAIDCPVNGIIIAGSGRWLSNSTSNIAWTGLTERDQQTVESANVQSVAADSFLTLQTNLAISASDQEIVAASWR